MYISNNKFRLAELKREHVAECAVLLGHNFAKLNKTWVTLGPSYEEVTQFMKEKVHEMLDWQEDCKSQGIIDKDTFINFVLSMLPRFTSTNMTEL